jgi:hypothetical protein
LREKFKSMILLKSQKPFASGEDRIVYQDPENLERCIKIPKQLFGETFNVRSIRDRLYLWTRGGNKEYFNYNYIDVCYIDWLKKTNNKRLFDHIPKCYGFVDTDLGLGVSWELIRNPDGSTCLSLRDCLEKPKILGKKENAMLRDGISDFFAWQLKHKIMLREMAFINTLIKWNKAGDRIRLYHIDAIGCVDLIPLAMYSDWFCRLRVKSKIYQFKKKLPWIK